MSVNNNFSLLAATYKDQLGQLYGKTEIEPRTAAPGYQEHLDENKKIK